MNTAAMTLPTQAPRPRRALWGRAWDSLSLYLPVLLMMLLALASYLLLRATPEPPKPPPERPLTHEPDYFMKRFSVKVYAENGALTAEMFGAEAHHFPDTDTVVIDGARVRAYNENSQLSTATARQIIANGAATEFELKEDAVVVRQAGKTSSGQRLSRMEFHGQYLKVSTKPEFVVSDQPVLLTRDLDQMTADALDYQGDEKQVVVLTGNVRAKLISKPR